MELHRYGERGLVNAWVESIARASDPEAAMDRCLARLVQLGAEPRVVEIGPIQDLRVYVEPSLSRFGDPDVVVLFESGAHGPQVLFIEAKTTPFLDSAPDGLPRAATPAHWYRRNCSSVLHELYLKSFFHHVAGDGRKRRCAYAAESSERWAGADAAVVDLAKRCLEAVPWFVALTTDLPPEPGAPWPLGERIAAQLRRIEVENGHPTGLADRAYLLSWHDLAAMAAKGDDLDRAIRDNVGKFVFPWVEDVESNAVLEQFWIHLGLVPGAERRTDGRRTRYLPGPPRRARLTYRYEAAFGGPELDVYLVPASREPGEPDARFRLGLDDLVRYREIGTKDFVCERSTPDQETPDPARSVPLDPAISSP